MKSWNKKTTDQFTTCAFSSAETSMKETLPVTSSFVGCIQEMKINEDSISFDRSSGVFGPVNLKECPGWADTSHCIILEQPLGPCPPPAMCNQLSRQRMCLFVRMCILRVSLWVCACLCVWMFARNRDMSSSLKVHNFCCSF